jgi:hypothetical protein
MNHLYFFIIWIAFFVEMNLIDQQYLCCFDQSYCRSWRHLNGLSFVCATMSLMISLLASTAFKDYILVPMSAAALQILYGFNCTKIISIF